MQACKSGDACGTQTGAMGLVMADIALDLVVFTILVSRSMPSEVAERCLKGWVDPGARVGQARVGRRSCKCTGLHKFHGRNFQDHYLSWVLLQCINGAIAHELVQLRIEAFLLESIRLLWLLYGRCVAYCVELQPQHHQPERMQLVKSNEWFCKDLWLSGLGPLYNKLGMDIVWQSLATFSTAISTFGLCVMVNQFDNNQVLAVWCSWPILYVFDPWLTDLSKYLHCQRFEHCFCHLRVSTLGYFFAMSLPFVMCQILYHLEGLRIHNDQAILEVSRFGEGVRVCNIRDGPLYWLPVHGPIRHLR